MKAEQWTVILVGVEPRRSFRLFSLEPKRQFFRVGLTTPGSRHQ
jgi:hypothetical protein